MNQPNNQKPNNSTKNPKFKGDSFIESFRGIGNGVASSAKNDLLKPGAQDIFNSLSPFPKNRNAQPGSNYDRPDMSSQNERFWENKYLQQKRQTEIVRREEKVVFTRQERETQSQVKGIREEIKNLAAATGELARDVQIAVMSEEVNPGTYHLNFLQKLLAIIKNLRTQIQDSSCWLQECGNKQKKKGQYWNRYKKSGSSFSLHHDRAVATQAG